ncbi:MAG: hypothetical protein JWM81_1011 [Candidatus Saccharibacteria bacterium]|nr:hypothetical protein [Candidatus Saccharibacteria bacterium]
MPRKSKAEIRSDRIFFGVIGFAIGGVILGGVAHFAQHVQNDETTVTAAGDTVHEYTISRSEMLETDALGVVVGGAIGALALNIVYTGNGGENHLLTDQERWDLFDD